MATPQVIDHDGNTPACIDYPPGLTKLDPGDGNGHFGIVRVTVHTKVDGLIVGELDVRTEGSYYWEVTNKVGDPEVMIDISLKWDHVSIQPIFKSSHDIVITIHYPDEVLNGRFL